MVNGASAIKNRAVAAFGPTKASSWRASLVWSCTFSGYGMGAVRWYPRKANSLESDPSGKSSLWRFEICRECEYAHQSSAARRRDALVGPEAATARLLIAGAPLNHAGRTQALRSGETGKDAGLAALGQGWPIAATRGAMPEGGHTEPEGGAEGWGRGALVTLRRGAQPLRKCPAVRAEP